MEKPKFKFPRLNSREKYRQGSFAGAVILFLIVHYLIDQPFLKGFISYKPLVQNASITLALIFLVMLIREILESLISRMSHDEGNEYNLIRVVRLIATILIIFVAISFMFQRPYASLAGLGLVSLVLGFALQAPITSFIAWLYIVFRKPYQVGDRIQIDNQRGDVIEISYLDTIIKEVSGDYLGNDRLSGRVIHFPNSIILTGKVINYSGDFNPFIWDETSVQISYTSDLKFVESCLLEATSRDFKEKYPTRSTKGQEPAVYFRVNKYAWLEAVVSYPVKPTDTTGRRNRILRYALPLMNAEPGKVGFPEGARR